MASNRLSELSSLDSDTLSDAEMQQHIEAVTDAQNTVANMLRRHVTTLAALITYARGCVCSALLGKVVHDFLLCMLACFHAVHCRGFCTAATSTPRRHKCLWAAGSCKKVRKFKVVSNAWMMRRRNAGEQQK